MATTPRAWRSGRPSGCCQPLHTPTDKQQPRSHFSLDGGASDSLLDVSSSCSPLAFGQTAVQTNNRCGHQEITETWWKRHLPLSCESEGLPSIFKKYKNGLWEEKDDRDWWHFVSATRRRRRIHQSLIECGWRHSLHSSPNIPLQIKNLYKSDQCGPIRLNCAIASDPGTQVRSWIEWHHRILQSWHSADSEACSKNIRNVYLPSELDCVVNGPIHMSLSRGNLSQRNMSGHG